MFFDDSDLAYGKLDKPVILNDNEKNKDRLQAILDDVQKRSRTRTVNVADFYDAVKRIEEYLDIPKNALDGVRAHVDIHAQTFPNAYHGTPESTQFEMIFEKRYWRVTRVWRAEVIQSFSRDVTMKLTDAARDAIAARFDHFSLLGL